MIIPNIYDVITYVSNPQFIGVVLEQLSQYKFKIFIIKNKNNTGFYKAGSLYIYQTALEIKWWFLQEIDSCLNTTLVIF